MKFRSLVYISLALFVLLSAENYAHAEKKLEIDESVWESERENYSFVKPIPREQKEEKEVEQKSNGSFLGSLLSWILLAIAIGILVFILIFLFGRYMKTRNERVKKKVVELDLEDIADDNISSGDYSSILEQTVKDGNYREAIRIRFLLLLKLLQESGRIRWKNESTNLDYLLVFSGTKLFNPFSELIQVFEITWYGERNVNSTDYSIVSSRFDEFQESISKRGE